MRRWEILALILVVGLVVWLGQIWLGQKPDPAPAPPAVANHCQPVWPAYETTATTINHRAPLAANGSPLPAPIAEDVVLEIASGGELVFWALDQPAGDWVLTYADGGFWRKLCLVGGRYFYYNVDEAVWDEADPEVLDPSILELADVDRYLLAADQLADFVATATASPDEPCAPNVCAVWLASSLDTDNEIRIRVNKQTKKTSDIFIAGPADQLVISFYYQPVDLKVPDPVRWLPEDLETN